MRVGGCDCGDDGSERSRGTPPNPSNPPAGVSLLTPVGRRVMIPIRRRFLTTTCGGTNFPSDTIVS
jgi:hypothetical protein